jgi:hypothetical protein
MKEQKFVEETIQRLLEAHMPPGYEEARRRIEERLEVPKRIERAAWELYEYKEEDRRKIIEKLRKAAKEVITDSVSGAGEIEVGLLAPESDEAEIERTFKASDRTRVLELVKAYAEDQGYSIEKPPQGSESLLDWRFGGRRLTLLKR